MVRNDEVQPMLVRRLLHAALGLILVYYLFPPRIFGISTKVLIVLLFILLPLCIEAYRTHKNTIFMGLREHERGRVASYAWFTTGAVILILFFPQQIAAPCILCAAFGDPLLGITRGFRRRYTFSITYIVLFTIFIIFQYHFILAVIGAGIVLISESVELRIQGRMRPQLFYSRSEKKVSRYRRFFDILLKTDDDFMMQVVPAIALMAIFVIIGPAYMPPELISVHPEIARFVG